MSSSITIREVDRTDMARLKRETRQAGLSMEEFVRRLIHEKRRKTVFQPKPSEAFARHFGERDGVELPPPARYGYVRQPAAR